MLRHVADELADVRAAGPDIQVEDGRLAGCRVDEPEEDLEQRALARPVRADEADDAGLDVEGQRVERGDAPGRIASSAT